MNATKAAQSYKIKDRIGIALVAGVWGLMTSAAAADWADQNREGVLDLLKPSVHASLDCADCHSGEANASSPGLPPAVDCSACHSDVQDVYAASIHGKAWERGDTEAARCSDCHGSHDIRSKKDPGAKVYRKRGSGIKFLKLWMDNNFNNFMLDPFPPDCQLCPALGQQARNDQNCQPMPALSLSLSKVVPSASLKLV